MKRFLVCACCFESENWGCPRCGNPPVLRDGLIRFAEDPSIARGGFKPEYFAQLARFEEGNFWFRARNRLIRWDLRNHFSDADNFFEVR